MWTSLGDAVTRAGSFDDLLPHLKAGGIMGRAAEFRTLKGALKERADNGIPTWWWWQLRRVDAAASRAWFDMSLKDRADDELLQRARHPELPTYDTADVLLAIGIELEQAAVEALFPAMAADTPKATAPAPRHAGGSPSQHDWEGATRHVEDWIAQHGPLPRNKKGEPILARAVELMTEWFRDNDPPPPKPRSIRRRIKKEPRTWWGPN